MERTSNPITGLETKINQIEQDLEGTVDSKIEEAFNNLFENDENFASKVKELQSLHESKGRIHFPSRIAHRREPKRLRAEYDRHPING